MNLGQLRTAVQNAVGAQSTDGVWGTPATVNGWINDAIHFIEADRDWAWLTKQVTFSITAGTDEYAAATFAPAGDWAHTLTVRIQSDFGPYLDAMGLVEADEQTDLSGRGEPKWFAVDHERMVFRPVPDATYTVVHRYQATDVELAADSDLPLMPARFHKTIVHYAAALGLLSLREPQRAAAQRAEFEAWRQRMANDDRRTRSPRIRERPW